MNFLRFSKFAVVAILLAIVASCGQKDEKPSQPALPKQANEQTAIRYVDYDSLSAKYNLAKDFNEASIRLQNNLEAKQKNLNEGIQAMQRQFAQKEKNNVYASNPQQAQADQAKLQKAYSDAQVQMENEQAKIQRELQGYQKTLNDSVDNFCKSYAKEKGYEIILNKQAALYIDPKYDVTDEIVKGLNKRYTKVAKPKK